MFIAAVFVIAPKWKQSKCPSTGEWINNLVSPYIGILFNNKKE